LLRSFERDEVSEIIRSKRIIAEKEGILGQKHLASRLTGNTMVLAGRMHALEPGALGSQFWLTHY